MTVSRRNSYPGSLIYTVTAEDRRQGQLIYDPALESPDAMVDAEPMMTDFSSSYVA